MRRRVAVVLRDLQRPSNEIMIQRYSVHPFSSGAGFAEYLLILQLFSFRDVILESIVKRI